MKSMATILKLSLFILLSSVSFSLTSGYYLAMWNTKKIIVEDWNRFEDNKGTWELRRIIDENRNNLKTDQGTKDTIPEDNIPSYENYVDSLKSLLKKYSDYSEQKAGYYISEYHPEFAKYTYLRPGDKLYLSTTRGVLEGTIDGYYINLDDFIGGGTVFYATLKVPGKSLFEDYEVLLCSSRMGASKLNRRGITNKDMKEEFKKYIMPRLGGIKTVDDEGNETILKKIKDTDIKIFRGSFTRKGKDEFLAGVTIRNDFYKYTNLIYVMDSEGNIINEFEPLMKEDYYFSTIDAVVDIDNDGVYELITNDGYYEGGSYNLQKFDGQKLVVKTSGFMFGV